MGLASDAIFSHHRDTEGHSNWSHITTTLYVLSACNGGGGRKSRIAEFLYHFPSVVFKDSSGTAQAYRELRSGYRKIKVPSAPIFLKVPNVNIPETETITFVRTHQEKRRRQLIKKNYGHGRTGEEKKGAA